MGWRSFSIGRVLGIRIALHPTWLVIAFLVTYALAAGDLPARFPGWIALAYVAVGAAVAMLFFASVLAHELSHALVARHFGIQVRDITLFIFGGAATLEGDAKTPGQEALIAAAGPASSLLLALVLIGASLLIDQPHVGAITGWLGIINLSLAIFNIIPAFPMDGGRDPARQPVAAARRPVRRHPRRGGGRAPVRLPAHRGGRVVGVHRRLLRAVAGADRLVPVECGRRHRHSRWASSARWLASRCAT